MSIVKERKLQRINYLGPMGPEWLELVGATPALIEFCGLA